MPQQKKKMALGDIWKLPKGETVVVRPGGTAVTARGTHVLDLPGTYSCGATQVEVPAEDDAKDKKSD